MAEVLFYHLTDSTLEAVLPGLVERSLARGWRAVIQTGSDERRDALDAHLWTYQEESFLGHGTDRDPYPADQQVFLTCSSANPNGAAIRFLCDGAISDDAAAYARVVVMFDGHDSEQVAGARGQWKLLKAAGHDVTYWQQVGGRWEKKA